MKTLAQRISEAREIKTNSFLANKFYQLENYLCRVGQNNMTKDERDIMCSLETVLEERGYDL